MKKLIIHVTENAVIDSYCKAKGIQWADFVKLWQNNGWTVTFKPKAL